MQGAEESSVEGRGKEGRELKGTERDERGEGSKEVRRGEENEGRCGR